MKEGIRQDLENGEREELEHSEAHGKPLDVSERAREHPGPGRRTPAGDLVTKGERPDLERQQDNRAWATKQRKLAVGQRSPSSAHTPDLFSHFHVSLGASMESAVPKLSQRPALSTQSF